MARWHWRHLMNAYSKCLNPLKLFFIGLGSFSRNFFRFSIFPEKWKLSNHHNFFSWTFLDKRFFVLVSEKAEVSENQDFAGLVCVALYKIIPFLLKKWFSIKIYGFWKFFWLKIKQKSSSISFGAKKGRFIVEFKILKIPPNWTYLYQSFKKIRCIKSYFRFRFSGNHAI